MIANVEIFFIFSLALPFNAEETYFYDDVDVVVSSSSSDGEDGNKDKGVKHLMMATAYTEAEGAFPSDHPAYGTTASGEKVRRGIIAADTDVLPMHSKVYVKADEWSGIYEVKDTGGAIVGNKIDIYVPTKDEAFKFGRRNVEVFVIEYGKV